MKALRILLADDQNLLSELLRNVSRKLPKDTPSPATLIAAFNHSTQRAAYGRLTSLIDGTNDQTAGIDAHGRSGVVEGSTPTFFSRNIGSLSSTLTDLQSERVVERVVGENVRQTVTYTWGGQ